MLWTLMSLLLQHIILAYSVLSAIEQSQRFEVEFFFLIFFFKHFLTTWFILPHPDLDLKLSFLDLIFAFLFLL